MAKQKPKRTRRDTKSDPLTDASVEHILRNNGAQRVSKKAVKELKHEMTAFGNKRASESVKVATYGKRKTVKSKDLIATR